MGISDILVILLFILPGMLSEKIANELDYASKNNSSDFINTVNGIMLSFPILLINGAVFAYIYKITTMKEFIDKLDKSLFLLTFVFSVLFTSFILGIKRESLQKRWIKFINQLRKKRDKMPSSEKNCWIKFLIEKNECRFLEVIIDGNSHKGFAYEYSTLNEDASIVLGIDEKLYEYEDFDVSKLFTKVVGTYIDIEKNVVIKDYDMSEYHKWCQNKTLENCATSS